jgi:prepilin-type N-terminal cleavage/methylation domain-containing protein
MENRPMRRRAFTMIELLIVVGIIAVLIALLLPAIQSARELARRASCSNNLLQLGIALGNYASTHSVFPPGVVNSTGPIQNLPVGYHHSWVVQILPFLGEKNVYRHFDQLQSVYAPDNSTAREVVIPTFLCPSSPSRGPISYAGCHNDAEAPIAANNNGVLYLNSRVGYDDITDGLATTVALGELSRGTATLGWASGTRSTLRNMGHALNEPDVLFPASRSAVFPNPPSEDDFAAVTSMVQDGSLPIDYVGGFASTHASGANFLFCNGSVRFVRTTVDGHIYQRLGNRADNELVADDAF